MPISFMEVQGRHLIWRSSADKLYGGDDNDKLYGGSSADKLYGRRR